MTVMHTLPQISWNLQKLTKLHYRETPVDYIGPLQLADTARPLQMASSSCSIAASRTRYDVFLSFRGTDTRHHFTSHLYAALSRKNLNSFIDEHDLERGEYISPSLLQAIGESKYLIVILSENYASSEWCLDELVKIMECKESMDRKVLPIFYHVEPSHVAEQKGNFGEGFKKLEERFTHDLHKVDQWRAALIEAADLSGEVSGHYRHECELIDRVAENIMKKLYPISFVASNQLVGIDLHIQRILSCLEMGSTGVYSLGLWGMSGIGKTTIAEVVYGQISRQFDRCGFFRNIREESENIGLVALRKKFFSKLLGIEIPDADMLCVLPAFIKDALCRLKVLVVLDDITDSSQLGALGVGEGLFGLGSRIIITSRDKQVLNFVDEIFEVEGLNCNDALQLLSMKAFKQMHPQNGYEELSEKVVKYAGGIPLALVVLGSHLHKRLPYEWDLQLNKLKQSPEPSIKRILKISYDGLEEDMLKDIFLDIACLFKGCTVNSVTDILDEWGVLRLCEKCLITIRDNAMEMHDLIQEMGRDIARNKGNWLWNHEDIYHLLTSSMRNEAVEGILLDMSKVESISLSSTALDMSNAMPNLRLLKFYHKLFWQKKHDPVLKLETSQSNHLLQLPHKLRLLHWEDYPFESMPSNFFMQNLVELTLLNSKIVKLWEGKSPKNLKRLDLSHSVHLRRLPDLSSARKMEKICLEDCQSLVEIPPSIQCLHNLTEFFLHWCINLRSIPSMSKLTSLRHLNLSYCPNLKMLPEIPTDIEWIELEGSGIEEWSSVPSWEKVTSLSMKNCKYLSRIPSLVHLKSLGILNLSGCSNLKMLPEIPNCIKRLELQQSGLEAWSAYIGKLENLRFIDMRFCRNLRSFPSLVHSGSLHTLNLQGCTSLRILPEIPVTLKFLEVEGSGLRDVQGFCNLNNKNAIQELPSSIRRVSSSLQEFSFRNCKHLEILPDSICELKCLQILDLSGCSKLAKLPPLNGLNSLKRLVLDGSGVVNIPSELPSFLIELHMENCKNLEILPDSICELRCLQTLVLNGCSKLANWPSWNGLKFVHMLKLNGNANLQFPREPPSSLSTSSLVELSMDNLQSLEILPVLDLKCLQLLKIWNCSKLVNLPPFNGLISLRDLHLISCGITEIPSKLPSSLDILIVESCSNLKIIPDSICELKCLQTLHLWYCPNLKKLPPLNGLNSLKKLLIDCTSIIEIPTELPVSLIYLRLRISDLKVLPDSICELKCLGILDLGGCWSLKMLPPLNGLNSLKDLLIECNSITEIPTELPVSLVIMRLSIRDLKVLPDNICELKCLDTLDLSGCSSLKMLPPLNGLKSLNKLCLSGSAIVEVPAELPSRPMILQLENCQFLRILPHTIFELEHLQIDLKGCSKFFKLLPARDLQSLVRLARSGREEIRYEIFLRERLWYRLCTAVRKTGRVLCGYRSTTH